MIGAGAFLVFLVVFASAEDCFQVEHKNKYSGNYPPSAQGHVFFYTHEDAMINCNKYDDCLAITHHGGTWSLRTSPELKDSPSGESTWMKGDCIVSRTVSHLVCENCKCGGDVMEQKSIEEISTRGACANAAVKAGAQYFNWLSFGPKGKCVFGLDGYGKDLSSKANCVNGRQTDTKRPWSIYSVADTKTKCDDVSYSQVCQECKCNTLHHIQFRDTIRTAVDAKACAEETYKAGYSRFSYRWDTFFCYYGPEISSKQACDDNRLDTANKHWGIYEASC